MTGTDRSTFPRASRYAGVRLPRVAGVSVVLAVALFALSACSSGLRLADDPGVRVWSTEDAAYVGSGLVTAAVQEAETILLGETHTIAAHHRLQARLIRRAAEGRRPAVVFEMVRRDQQAEIDAWRAAGADPAGFGPAVAWEQRGWPDWSLYQPIVEAAVASDLPIYGAAPSEETSRHVARDGFEAIEAARRRALGLDRELPAAGGERLRAALRASHCNVGGDAVVNAMLRVQRLRDAYLAERLRTAVAEHGAAVLIAGRGHTRSDHGVPLYLRGGPGASRIVSVGFAGTGEFEDVGALRRAQGGVLAHDYVWLTPGGEPAPGCDEARERG